MFFMDVWTKKSIALAASRGYLDDLHAIYPANSSLERELPETLIDNIKFAYEAKNKVELVSLIADLACKEKSPIDDSYLGSLKLDRHIIENNPRTVERIANRLLDLSWEDLLKRCSEPKKASRQLGDAFKSWVKTIGFPPYELSIFVKAKGICTLDESDTVMKKYATKSLKCKLKEKADLDFVAKVETKYIIGAAKFITTAGGSQDNQFFNMIDFAEEKSGIPIRIAIADGAVWFPQSGRTYKRICSSNGIIISGLLLKDFVESLI